MQKVGTIINTHGLKGVCKIQLTTDSPAERFASGQTLYTENQRPLTVVSFRIQKGFGYCQFEEIRTIEQAEAIKPMDLYIREEDLPEPEDGHYYYYQLMHCTVYNEQNEELGEVTDILETGANAVLRINSGKGTFLCPYVPAFILAVDPEAKTIHIREIEGLR